MKDIWAKAITRKHGRILQRVGATHPRGIGAAHPARRDRRRRKRAGEDFTHARPETEVRRHDHLIVSGPTHLVEKFCQSR